MERRNIIPAMALLTASLGVATAHATEPPSRSEGIACTEASLPAVNVDITDMQYAAMEEGVRDIDFLVHESELTRQNQENYVDLLARNGITVVEEDKEQDADGGNEWLF